MEMTAKTAVNTDEIIVSAIIATMPNMDNYELAQVFFLTDSGKLGGEQNARLFSALTTFLNNEGLVGKVNDLILVMDKA